jgi:hypothetical protein
VLVRCRCDAWFFDPTNVQVIWPLLNLAFPQRLTDRRDTDELFAAAAHNEQHLRS